jgi:hypothetical protein
LAILLKGGGCGLVLLLWFLGVMDMVSGSIDSPLKYGSIDREELELKKLETGWSRW